MIKTEALPLMAPTGSRELLATFVDEVAHPSLRRIATWPADDSNRIDELPAHTLLRRWLLDPFSIGADTAAPC